MFQRLIKPSQRHPFFLFGPRGVGKTTFLQSFLPKNATATFDLLDHDLEERLIQRPKEFQELLDSLDSSIRWVFIDEVQKLPYLLDEVHRQIEKNPNRYFSLTGSSARKLKHAQANLLAGRAFTYEMAPLTTQEMADAFDLKQALLFGTLPKCVQLENDEDKNLFLKSYAQTYLKEEVQMEGIVREMQAFRRFLPMAASENGNVLSWSNFAQEVGMDAKTVRSYFEILEDTFLGFLLPAYHRSLRKRQKTHPKFYLFDTGVKRALANELSLDLVPGTSEYGRAFEHFWILEMMRMNAYLQRDFTFSYLATNDIEIDLVIERPGEPLLFVEIKSSERVKDAQLKALISITRDVKKSQGFCICREPRIRKIENVTVFPWQQALQHIGLSH